MRLGTVLSKWVRRSGDYGLALLFVAVAALLRLALWDVLSPAPTLVFYLAWVGAAAFGGLGPGLLATVASWLCIELLFDSTPGQIGFSDPMSIGRLSVLLAGGLVVSLVGEKMRRTRIHERRQMYELADLTQLTNLGQLLIRDEQDHILLWSDGCARLYGFTAEQAIGRISQELLQTEFSQPLEAIRATLHQTGRWEGEQTQRRADGSVVHVASSWVLRKGTAHPVVLEVNNDTTDRKHAEEALREARDGLEARVQERAAAVHESDERLRFALESCHIGTWDLDLVDRTAFHSLEHDRIFGYAQLLPQWTFDDFLQHLLPEYRAEVEAMVRDATAAQRGLTSECRIRRADGAIRWIWFSGRYRTDPSGRPRVAGVVLDITERKRAEAELAKHREHLEELVQERTRQLEAANEALGERMKELACLHAVSRDMQEELSLDELCRRAVEHLLPAMQYPELTVVVIELNDKRFTSENYGAGLSHGLQAQIRVEGEILGHVRVYYAQEEPFLIPEEQNLVNGVAAALSTWLERQRAEEALRAGEQRYRKLFEANLAGVYLTKPDGTILDFNDAMMRMLGYDSREELFQHRSTEFFADPEFRNELLRLLRKDGIVPAKEAVLRRKDGSVLYALGAGVLLADEQTGEPYIQGVALDITESKHAEEALRQSERQFKSTFENAAIGIAHVALDGRILQSNSRFCEIAGYSCDEVLGKTCQQITFADDWQAEEVQMQHLLEGRVDHYAIEKRYVRRDGSPVWVNLTRSIQRDEAGRPEYFIVLVEDISERRQAEEALRELTTTLESKVSQRTAELRHRARQLQKLTLDMSVAEERERERMAEILHDDLQQLLAAAKFHVGLMRNRARHDASLQATAAQVDQMLKEAIDKSRSLSHELSPAVMHHADFAETLRWLANEIQAKHGLVVHVHAYGHVRSRSEALKAFLFRAVQELLFNVVKHARVHEASIRVRRLGRCLCLSVSDRGRGFDPQALEETAGYGLLSIRERIELLGGRMTIKSAQGQGSTLRIVVPDSEKPEDTVGVGPRAYPTSATPGGRGGKEGGHGGPPLRVLLADDHEIVREGLISLLREEPTVEVVGEAANGREAIDLAGRLEPDVVIMDVAMPLIDGDEATRQIKAHLPEMRVIALSMYDEPEKMESMYRAGAESYVLKTASSEELLAAVRGEESDLKKNPASSKSDDDR